MASVCSCAVTVGFIAAGRLCVPESNLSLSGKVINVCVCVFSGACEGTLACSTCHLIFEDEVYKNLGRITDEEMDMLDLAYGLTDT